MAGSSIDFFYVMSVQQQRDVTVLGHMPLGFFGDRRDYIGLRENIPDAAVRADTWSGNTISHGTHVALKIKFTAAGLAHYATLCSGRDRYYAPTLSKKVFSDTTRDWKIWHFCDVLPLDSSTADGILHISHEWVSLPIPVPGM